MVGPLHSDNDDEASSGAGDWDADVDLLDGYGRPKPQGVAVIAPGSVSNARAKMVRVNSSLIERHQPSAVS